MKETPLEHYLVSNKQVYVKRDDLCSPFPNANISKARGIYEHLIKMKKLGIENIGVVDTEPSRSGWCTAYFCNMLGLKLYDFYPLHKNKTLNFNQIMCKSFGAELIPQVDCRYSIRYARAKKYMNSLDNSYLMPYLNLYQENIEIIMKLTMDIFRDKKFKSVVTSFGSGASFIGIIKGLSLMNNTECTVFGVLSDKNVNGVLRFEKMRRFLGVHNFQSLPKMKIVSSGFDYKEKVYVNSPFPCDLYYDQKAWKWLIDNIDNLEEPILFWNHGGEWDEYGLGLNHNLRGDGVVTYQDIIEYLKSRGLNYA